MNKTSLFRPKEQAELLHARHYNELDSDHLLEEVGKHGSERTL